MPPEEVTKPSSWPCIAAAALASLVLGISILFFPTTWNPGLPLLLAGVFATLAGLGRILFGLGTYYRAESDLATVLLIWMGICCLYTLDLYTSQRSLASFAGGVAFLLFCQATIRTRKHWRGVAYALIGVCVFASILAWFAALVQARQTGVLPPLKGTFANHDTFSVLPLIGVCLVLGLVEKSGPKLTWFNLALGGFFLLTLFATGCRAALVGFVAAALVFFLPLHILRKDRSEKTRLFVGFPLLLTLLFVPLAGYQFASGAKWGQLADGSALQRESIRLELFENGWRAIMQNPLFGAGPGAFGQSYQTVRPPDHEDLYINIAHNDFLEMGVECGVLGLVLWCALTWFAAYIPWTHLKDGRRPTEAAAVMGAVVALAAFSIFNFIIIQRPVLWAQLWLFGLAFSFPNNRVRWEEAKGVRLVAGLALVGFGAWATLWGYRSFRAEALYLQGTLAEQELKLEEANQLYDQAAALEAPRWERVLLRQGLMEKLRLFNGQDNLNDQLSLLEKGRAANPRRLPLLLRLASVQEAADQTDAARSTLDFAQEVAPSNREVFTERLTFLVSQGDFKTAATALTNHTYSQWAENKDRFSTVMLALFQTQPSDGAKILKDWLEAHPDERGYELAEQAAAQARAAQDWPTESAILLLWKKADKKNLCLEEMYAKALGQDKGEKEEFDYLSRLLKQPLENSDACYSKLLQRWAQLGIVQGQVQEVETKLSEFLQVAPHRHWARGLLGELKAAQGKPKEGLALLREGLEKKPNNPTLLMSMARVFERQGSRELALNYYREVTRYEPDNSEAQAKVKALVLGR
jgi:O-antigen ligase